MRVYVTTSTKEYARLYQISERTARRRITSIDSAVKTSKGWRIPLPATEYAKRSGISASAARRKGVRANSVTELVQKITEAHKKQPTVLQKQAAERRIQLLANARRKRDVNVRTVYERMMKAKMAQLKAMLNTYNENDLDYSDDEWIDDDGVSILNYH